MNYISTLNKQWHKITNSRHFQNTFSINKIANLLQLNNKDIVEFSKIKVNIERKKIDKYVPNRYIPKIGDNGKMYKMLDVIAKDELKYLQYTRKEYLKNRRFDESKNTKLNSIRADVFKQEAIFKDMIFKGIKSDIETIGLYRHEPEKTNLKAINNAEIEEKLVCQALTDISNFTGQNHRLINSQINEIYNNNNKITRNQKQIDKIGFWKGNFFGTKDEKQLYLSSKNENIYLENSTNETFNLIKENIDKTIHISSLTNKANFQNMTALPVNFENSTYKDNAIAHANTEIELKEFAITKILNDENIPQFLMDRNFIRDADENHISDEIPVGKEQNSILIYQLNTIPEQK